MEFFNPGMMTIVAAGIGLTAGITETVIGNGTIGATATDADINVIYL